MKLTALIMMIACLQVSAKGYTQTVTLSLQNATLTEAFTQIKKQTGFNFIYDRDDIKNARPISIAIKNVSVQAALDECLKGQPYEYTIIDNNVVVKLKVSSAPKPVLTEAVAPNPIDVKGKVVNEKGEPVAGVTVSIKGSSIATYTNSDGEFSLNSVDKNAVLVFTSINMEPFELMVSGKSELLINLRTKVSALGDVTVTVNTGYQSLSKERATGSFTKIDNALFNRQVSTDLLSRLDGIANGLLFDKRGGLHLQIRGISTINSNAEPLIILDNFPYTGNIDNINPNDVENITILRDAAAASIWGARAGNGVIVITTKKGQYNQPFHVSVSSNVTVQEKPDLYYFPQLSTSDFIDVEQYLFDKGLYTSQLNAPKQYVTSPVVKILNQQKNNAITAEEAARQINSLRGLDIRKDYEKYVFRSGINNQNYLNFNGGSNLFAYMFSVGYDNNRSNIQAGGGYSRFSINSNNIYRPIKSLELTAGINISQGNHNEFSFPYPIAPGSQAKRLQLYPYERLVNAEGNPTAVPMDRDISYVDNLPSQLLDWHYNPLNEIRYADNSDKTQFALFTVGAKIRLLSWLNAEIKYQYGQQTGRIRNYYSPETYFTRNLINQYTDPNTFKRNIPLGGILDQGSSELKTENFRAQLNFNKSWLNKHEVLALVAAESGKSNLYSGRNRLYGYNDNVLAYATNIDYADLYPLYLGGSAQIPNIDQVNEYANRNVSFLGNLSYTYDERYSVYASARKDGANIFGVKANNRWKPLWSTGVSWNVSKESFFNIQWLSNLRVRASYGYTGNANNQIPAVTIIAYNSSLNAFTNTPYASLINAPNPELKWEEVGIFNVGMDFGLFRNRISGSIEWYRKKSKDVISKFPIDPTLGIPGGVTTLNAAELSGQGIDLVINSDNLSGVFKWNTTFNFNYAKTIVTKYYTSQLFGLPSPFTINPVEGKIAWGLYAYQWAGLDPATGDPQGYYNKQVSKNYLSIINDSSYKNRLVGSSLPLYFGNIMNSFSFHGFTLSANVVYRLAYYFRKPTIRYDELFNGWVGHADYVNRWQKPGDENFTTVPSRTYPSNPNRDIFYANSEANVEKGDHISLQDVRLSYNWANGSLKKIPVQSLQLFVYAGNLNINIWKASESSYNPDFASSVLPPSRTWTAGVNIKF